MNFKLRKKNNGSYSIKIETKYNVLHWKNSQSANDLYDELMRANKYNNCVTKDADMRALIAFALDMLDFDIRNKW